MQQADSNLIFDASRAFEEAEECAFFPSAEIFKILTEFKSPSDTASSWWTVKFAFGLLFFATNGIAAALTRFALIPATPAFTVQAAVSGIALAFLGIPLIRGLTSKTVILRTRPNWTKLPALLTAFLSFALAFVSLTRNGANSSITLMLISFAPVSLTMLSLLNALSDAGGMTSDPALTTLRVETAYQSVQDRILPVPTDSLKLGDVFSVRAGEKIPRDGTVLRGTTGVDESALTGDPRPRLKERGEPVVGGSLNRDGDILVQVTNVRSEDTLERLIAKTEHTLASPPTACRQMDLVSKTGLALSFALATLAFACAFFLRGMDPLAASLPAMAALLASPLSAGKSCRDGFIKLIAAARAKGIVFSGGTDVESLARVNSVFFNKTGTLTRGDFTFSQVFIESGTNQGELLYSLFSIEQDLSHPLAKAMETHPWYIEMPAQPVRDVRVSPGLGVSAIVCPRGGADPYLAAAGNLRFVKRMRFFVSRDMKAKMDDLEEMGETAILVGYDRQVHGILSFSDTLRKGVRSTLRSLQRLGLETALITGDTEKTVTHLTGTLGIKKIHSRCTPEEKSAKIAKERESGAKVAVVDSDRDDNSALKAADISLSLDTGTAIAGHQANILLLGPDFTLIRWLFTACRRFDRAARIFGWGGTGLGVILAAAAIAACLPPHVSVIASLGWSALSLRASQPDA